MDHPVYVINVGSMIGPLVGVALLAVLGGIYVWARVSDWWRVRRAERRARRDRRRLL